MQNDNRSPDRGMGTGLIAGFGAAALVAALIIWAPWDGSHVVERSTPGTTVGSLTTRLGAPTAPAPAAPSTPR
jgi:hypothetical protein